jgi:Uma2 family endonuclease
LTLTSLTLPSFLICLRRAIEAYRNQEYNNFRQIVVEDMVSSAKFTLEEYHQLVDTGLLSQKRIEFIEGELLELSPEKPIHASTNTELFFYFYTLFKDNCLIRQAHPITLSNSEPQPDIVLCQLPNSTYYNRHPYPDDIYLVIEISYTTLKYDSTIKRSIYARDNIKEYWIIDVENKKVIVFKNPQNEDYLFQQEYRQGTLTLEAFPSIDINVEALFIVFNLSLTLLNLYIVIRIWQIWRVLVKVTRTLDRVERRIHRIFAPAPEFVLKGQKGTHTLRLRYQRLLIQLAIAGQFLSVISFGVRFWQKQSRRRRYTRSKKLFLAI